MRNGLRRAVVLVVAFAVCVTGAVQAAAEPENPAADRVRELRADLAMAGEAQDVPAARATLGELRPLLAELATGERYAVDDGSRSLAAAADTDAADVVSQLDAKSDVPPLGPLLNMLLQKLLDALSHLLDQLLGALPMPV